MGSITVSRYPNDCESLVGSQRIVMVSPSQNDGCRSGSWQDSQGIRDRW